MIFRVFTRSCEDCEIRYPATHQTCLVCNGPTKLVAGLPHEDWKDQVEVAKKAAAGDELELIREVPGVVNVYEEHGRLWVQQVDLSRKGVVLSHLQSFSLIELNGVVYELQGWHFSKRRWWIQRAVPTEAPA